MLAATLSATSALIHGREIGDQWNLAPPHAIVLADSGSLLAIGNGSAPYAEDYVAKTGAALAFKALSDALVEAVVAEHRRAGAMPEADKTGELERLQAAIAERRAELRRRDVEARKAELEAELAEIEA